MKYITIICLLLIIVAFGAEAQINYKHSAKVISSGADWSSGTNYRNFGVIGEPIVSHKITNTNVNGGLGFIITAKVESVNPPPPAILIYPPDNTLLSHLPDSSLSITFFWMSASSVSYNIQMSDSQNFSNLMLDTVLSVNYFTAKIKSDGQFYWRVRVLRGNLVSEWSTIWKFYIITTGIEAENQLQVYPNPTRNIVQVVLPPELVGGNIAIIDLLGKIRFSVSNINHINAFDVDNLEAGIYLMTITKGQNIIIRKLVKQ